MKPKSQSSNFWIIFVFSVINIVIGGWVHEPLYRMGISTLLVAGWVFYTWWSDRSETKLFFYFLLGLAIFTLLLWINPLLPWWLFTWGVTVGALLLFVFLHWQAWQVMDSSQQPTRDASNPKKDLM